MKYTDADGNVTYGPPYNESKYPSRTSREPYALSKVKKGEPASYPICGQEKKNGGTCGNPAGKGTNHLGVGYCAIHNGKRQIIGKGELKNTLVRSITYPGIQEEFKRLSEDRDVFDLREHIHLMEAIIVTILNKAQTMEDLGQVIKYVQATSKTIQSLDEIEHGRRLVIDIQGLNIIFAKVTEVIHRYVPDSYTRDLIGKDLAGIPVGDATITDIPYEELNEDQSRDEGGTASAYDRHGQHGNSLVVGGSGSKNISHGKQGTVIEGVAMEVRPRDGS
jgi:hypothetical protein